MANRIGADVLHKSECLNEQLQSPVTYPVIDLALGDARKSEVLQGIVHRIANFRCSLDQGAIQVEQDQFVAFHAARFFLSIMRQMKGVKISCMASSIFPPGTTMVLARLM